MRVEWLELRRRGWFAVIGELTKDDWAFWDREVWEVLWSPMTPTSSLVDKARSLIGSAAHVDADGMTRK